MLQAFYGVDAPGCRNPSMIPPRTLSANCPALPRVMWPKYCSFSFATRLVNSLSRPNSVNIESFVRCSCYEMLSIFLQHHKLHSICLLVNRSNVRASVRAVSTFSKPQVSRDRWADVDETWHIYSVGLGTEPAGSGILNFGTCAAWGHPELRAVGRDGRVAYCTIVYIYIVKMSYIYTLSSHTFS